MTSSVQKILKRGTFCDTKNKGSKAGGLNSLARNQDFAEEEGLKSQVKKLHLFVGFIFAKLAPPPQDICFGT